MPKRSDFALFPNNTFLDSEGSVADGNYDFPLIGGEDAAVQNFLNYFYFVDVSGVLAPATTGSITILGSPDNKVTWLSMAAGTFNANKAEDPDRARPSGISKLTHVRISLTNIGGAGIDSFIGEFIQTQGI